MPPPGVIELWSRMANGVGTVNRSRGQTAGGTLPIMASLKPERGVLNVEMKTDQTVLPALATWLSSSSCHDRSSWVRHKRERGLQP